MNMVTFHSYVSLPEGSVHPPKMKSFSNIFVPWLDVDIPPFLRDEIMGVLIVSSTLVSGQVSLWHLRLCWHHQVCIAAKVWRLNVRAFWSRISTIRSGNQTWRAGKWTIYHGCPDEDLHSKGIFQPAMFDDTRGQFMFTISSRFTMINHH